MKEWKSDGQCTKKKMRNGKSCKRKEMENEEKLEKNFAKKDNRKWKQHKWEKKTEEIIWKLRWNQPKSVWRRKKKVRRFDVLIQCLRTQ